MAEDWRVTVDLAGGGGTELHSALHRLEDEAKLELGGRVAVSASGSNVFVYADTRAVAEQAESAIRELLGRDGVEGELVLDRWHPIEEKWEPADVPLPATDADRAREERVLDQQDDADSEESGYAEWEVRIDLEHRHDAVELQRKLEAEGLPVTRRWTFLLVGAEDRDAAGELERRLADEIPANARIRVEPGSEMVWDVVGHDWAGSG